MIILYDVDPDSFPEAMYVQMPDRPGQPVLLPVVRMGCDTALVVIPPSKNRNQASVSMTPVKTASARPNGMYNCLFKIMYETKKSSEGTISTTMETTTATSSSSH